MMFRLSSIPNKNIYTSQSASFGVVADFVNKKIEKINPKCFGMETQIMVIENQ